jgi:hypothetical protein
MRWNSFGIGLAALLAGCQEDYTEAITPDELEATERGAFTASGRFFVIGTRTEPRSDAGGWIVELTKAAGSGFTATNLVAGTLEGTADGKIGGPPSGGPCTFSGMAAQGELLYAACVDSVNLDRAALLQVDLAQRSVRAGYFTSCNAEQAATDCSYTAFYPNGMSIDAAGRVYVSDTAAHLGELLDEPGSPTLTQISVDAQASQGARLVFKHRAWFSNDIFADGLSPNGVQIEGDILYYAAGSNINKVRIAADGSAGEFRVHYEGALASYIDDFAIRDGVIVTAHALPSQLLKLSAADFSGMAQEVGAYDMPLTTAPSSASFQPEGRPAGLIFPAGSLVLTSFFGGGVQVLAFSALR